MRILRVAQEIYPDVVGGGAYHAHALSRDQVKRGHNVTVLTISTDPTKPKREERDGYTIIRCSPNVQPLGNAISIESIRYLWNNISKFDIVHAHAHFYTMSNFAALFNYFNNVPLTITNHSLISQSVPRMIAKFHLNTIGKYTFNQSSSIFCYTEEEQKRLREKNIRSDIYVVSNGIDHERFSPNGPPSPHINDSETVILFVGRLVDGKRPQDVIDAFSMLNEDYNNLSLYICGDGPLRDSVERSVVEQNLNSSVHFLGQVDYDEMPKIYRDADVLALPSASEGFPRTVLEALSTQTPVVASELDQTKETVEKGGETFQVGNINQLASSLRLLVNDSDLREELGETGREYLIEKGYTWENTVDETTKILNRIAKSY